MGRERQCTKCGTSYEHYGQKLSLCRPCRNEYNREYHAKRSTEAKKRKSKLQLERHHRIRVKINEYTSKQSCEHCGIDNPIVLEYHHRDPEQKEFNIGDMKGRSIETVMNEIAKCQVLCANCHRIEHDRISQSA